METLLSSQYNELIATSEVIEEDGYGEKVLHMPNGMFVKIFRLKHMLSSALFSPYGLRFAANAERLARLGIRSIDVIKTCYCADKRRHLVFYRPLPGITLRQHLAEKSQTPPTLHDFAAFLALLHKKGVYFRSVHFGNVIVQSDEEQMGLIDIADMVIKPGGLKANQCARNFKHFLRYTEDVSALQDYGQKRFLEDYLDQMRFSDRDRRTFLLTLAKRAPFFQDDSLALLQG